MRKYLSVVAIVGVMLSLSSCDFARVGARCSASQGAARNDTHVLFCVKGRWKATVTIGQAADIVVGAWPGTATALAGTNLKVQPEHEISPLVFRVLDRKGRPAVNTPVTLGDTDPATGAGLVGGADRIRATTDAGGYLRTAEVSGLRVAPTVGTFTLGVYGPLPDPIGSVTITVSGGRPASIDIVAGRGQSIVAGGSFAPFRLVVRDAAGYAVSGASLVVDGLAGAVVQEADGAYTVTAPAQTAARSTSFGVRATEPGPFGPITLGSTSVPYTVLPGPIDDARIDGDLQDAPVTTHYAHDLMVTPLDRYDNVVPNVAVTFTAVPGLSGASATLTPFGGATYSGVEVVANGIAGTFTVHADIPGLGSYDFDLENTP